MVWSKDLIPDDVVAHVVVDDAFRSYEVVQTPANVFGARVHHVRPESVGLLLKNSYRKLLKCFRIKGKSWEMSFVKLSKSKSLCSQILDCNLQYKAATEIGKGIHTNVKS